MTIQITLTMGADTGPFFDLYSNIDGFAVPFLTNVPKASLTGGTNLSAPDGATTIRVFSKGVCVNSVDITTTAPTTTTTTTSTTTTTTATPTTTTTTTATPTTTTTTTAAPECLEYSIFANQGQLFNVSYTNCSGAPDSIIIDAGDEFPVCSITVPSINSGAGSITLTGLDNCSTITTTTTTAFDSNCTTYVLYNAQQGDEAFSYTPCGGSTTVSDFASGQAATPPFCAINGTLVYGGNIFIQSSNPGCI